MLLCFIFSSLLIQIGLINYTIVFKVNQVSDYDEDSALTIDH